MHGLRINGSRARAPMIPMMVPGAGLPAGRVLRGRHIRGDESLRGVRGGLPPLSERRRLRTIEAMT
jgi:hypothetical protein